MARQNGPAVELRRVNANSTGRTIGQNLMFETGR